MITNENATWNTIRRTVDCPYCGIGFSFRSETKFQEWIIKGRKDPLHAACKRKHQMPTKEQMNDIIVRLRDRIDL